MNTLIPILILSTILIFLNIKDLWMEMNMNNRKLSILRVATFFYNISAIVFLSVLLIGAVWNAEK